MIYPHTETKKELFEEANEVRESALIPDGEYTLRQKIKGTANYVEGVLLVSNGKYILKKGAKLGPLSVDLSPGWSKIRNIFKGTITDRDIECSSPSMAGGIVVGHPINGWKVWKKGTFAIDIFRKDNDEE